MRAQLGTHVRTRDDKDLGAVEWVLVDPETLAVKSLGVRHGHIREHAVKIPLEEISVSPNQENLVAAIDEAQTRNLTHRSAHDQTGIDTGDAVAASVGGGVWPANAFATKRRDTSAAPLHTELQEMVDMVNSDVVVLGDGSDVYSKDMKHVGEIEQVRFETHTGQLLSLGMKGGFLHHREFELPGDFIGGADEGSVYLTLDHEDVKQHILERNR